MKMVINNIKEFAKWYGCNEEQLAREIYKGTDCGAWIDWTDATVRIGSIVEGSDAEFSREFTFPLSSTTIEDWFEELEILCTETWNEANEEEEEGVYLN